MKIHFDSDIFNRNIFPNNSKAKSELREAIGILNDVYIPYDFTYRDTLKGYPSKIEDIHGNVNKFNNWADAVKTKIEKAEEIYLTTASRINFHEIKKRNSMIIK